MRNKQQIILVVACTAVFIEALDIAILNIAFPLIEAYFNYGSETLQWLQTIYVLFYGGFLILGGKLADAVGHKKLFLTGSSFFLIASIGAGFSTVFSALLLFRALQGLAAAIAIPSSIAIIRNTFKEDQQKNKALGLFSSFAGIGSGIGLALGGIIATYFGWQWVFFINIPIITVVLILGNLYIDKDERAMVSNRSDFALGTTLTLVAILTSYFIHDLANIKEHFITLAPIFCFIIAGSALFYYHNKKAVQPLIDITLFKNEKTALGNMNTFLLGAIFFSYLVLFPLFIQQQLQFTAAQTGFILFPFSFFSALAAKLLIPKLFKKLGIIKTGIIGMSLLLSGATFFALAIIIGNSYALLFFSLLCMSGLGIAVSYPSLAVMALQDIPDNQQGIAAGVNQTAYFFGAGFGLSMIGLIVQIPTSAIFPITYAKTLWPVLLLAVFAIAALLRLLLFQRKIRYVTSSF